LKYERFTPSGCKDIWVRKYKIVAKTPLPFSKSTEKIIKEQQLKF